MSFQPYQMLPVGLSKHAPPHHFSSPSATEGSLHAQLDPMFPIHPNASCRHVHQAPVLPSLCAPKPENSCSTFPYLCGCPGRHCEIAVENPSWSCLWRWPPMKAALEECTLDNEAVAHRCAWDTARDGKRLWKQYKFRSTGSWICKTARKCNCRTKKHNNLTRTDISECGKKSVSGIGTALRKSSAYPRALGKLVIHAWKHKAQTPASSLPASSSSRHPVPQGMLGTSRNEACTWLQPTAEENLSREAVQRPGKKAKLTAAWLQPAAGSESIHHQAPGSKQKRALSTTEVGGWLQPSANGQRWAFFCCSSASLLAALSNSGLNYGLGFEFTIGLLWVCLQNIVSPTSCVMWFVS